MPSFLDGNNENGIDVTSPQIQPPGTIARFAESDGKQYFKNIHCKNDHIHYDLGNKLITVTPRSRNKSETLFNIARKFIENGGMQKLFDKLRETMNPNLLTIFFCAISGIASLYHLKYAEEMYRQMKDILAIYNT